MRLTVPAVVLWSISTATLATAASSAVNVWLRSSWDAAPLLLEVLESAALEDASIYFPLLNLLTSHTSILANLTPRDQITSIYSLIENSQLPLQHPQWDFSSFKASLAMHEASPKIQAYYQYYDTVVNGTKAGITAGQACESWVEWRGKGFCKVEELKRDMESALSEGPASSKSVEIPGILPFDHIYPQSYISSPHPPAILYLSDLSPAQAGLYEYLIHHAEKDDSFEVIVRYRPTRAGGATEEDVNRRKNSLKGYGVEMVLKRTDYLAVDDRETASVDARKAQQVFPAAAEAENSSSGYSSVIGDGSWNELVETPLKAAEINNIGLQSASLILSDDDPLSALIDISQDFPKHSAAIARKVAVNETVRGEVMMNQQNIRSLRNVAWINGRVVLESEMHAINLLSILREERQRIHSLISLGLTPQQSYELLTDEQISNAFLEPDPMEGMYDASDRQEGGGVITWWNDLEKDKRYASWTKAISAIMRPQGPVPASVKLNMWNVILALDLSKPTSLAMIGQHIQTLIKRQIPLRFGLVPILAEDDSHDSLKMARILMHIIKVRGRAEAMEFIATILRASPRASLNLRVIESLYTSLAGREGSEPLVPYAEVIGSGAFNSQEVKIRSWLKRLGLSLASEEAGAVFTNGRYRPMDERWVDRAVQDAMSQLSYLYQPGKLAELKAAKKVSTYFYDQPTTASRRNVYISQEVSKQRIYNMQSVFGASLPVSQQYIYPELGEEKEILSTIYVVGDLDSQSGRDLARNAMEYLIQEHAHVRVGFAHTPSTESSYHTPVRFSVLLHKALATSVLQEIQPSQILDVLSDIDSTVIGSKTRLGSVWQQVFQADDDEDADIFESINSSPALTLEARTFWDRIGDSAKSLNLVPGAQYLISNGRLLGPLQADDFSADDFSLLEQHETKSRTGPILRTLRTFYGDFGALPRVQRANLLSGISSIIGSTFATEAASPRSTGVRARPENLISAEHSAIRTGKFDTALIRAFAVLDPASEAAQRWSSVLQMVSRFDHSTLTVVLNPALDLTEIPIKRFYRYELENELAFNADGTEAITGASFRALPAEPILTLGMDIPSSWLVRPKDSVHDLDNLQLQTILARQELPVVDIRFELEQLAIEGHANEAEGGIPRGLELQLLNLDGDVIGDTSVMANLGYFQFKTSPGLYNVAIREGRGRDIYAISQLGTLGSGGAVQSGQETVAVTSFNGITVLPTFSRRPGMQTADVLQEVEESTTTGFFNRIISSISTVFGKVKPAVLPPADINIFTVASGKLYERFASIMVLSVLKHTQSTVKFWFIENFLSPSFLEFLPHFAAEYGFQYELVTYKWPSWLRAQKEKQREIWGYKILFLDVLFPLSLDKVIFVDAGKCSSCYQIVRTDMKELVDLDLDGKVYGYAPMGDDKPEMEGFRFWKTGYWRDALRGKPYHISALYVVDLKRFRQRAAGDQLRANYQALSADPNSLANLDQDLPNSMQFQLPIHTLDRSWLWCETWCSQESLKEAKTIDLCQNPLTKQPKLERAKQIPEWEVYDNEVASFAKRLAEANRSVTVESASAEDLDKKQSGETGAKAEEQQIEEELGIQHDGESEMVWEVVHEIKDEDLWSDKEELKHIAGDVAEEGEERGRITDEL